VLAVGPNGVGKTNLLEALHVATQGFSPRTRTDSQLIRFGQHASRVRVRGRRGTVPLEIELTLEAGAAKKANVNGAPLRAAEQLRSETATLVFTPDRLGVVKGAPAARRAYFDRVLGRLSPAKAQLPAAYGAAVAQRNASLRRVAAGFSTRDALAPWTEQVALLGSDLVAARKETLALLGAPFAERAGELGLVDAELRYDGEPPTATALEDRLDRDLDRGATGLGPHLHDVVVASGTRDLRSFGSQGEQRLAVLALLLAEGELITERRGIPPLLLLDDVLSELDPGRRRILAARVARGGQALVTATDAAMLPAEPDQLVEVSPGTAR
jgi:DNA replication and repair protein RecF